MPRLLPICLCLLAVAGPAAAAGLDFDRTAPPDTVPDLPGFQARIQREGRVLIGGQPDREALVEVARRGVTCVVNLRTPGEMENRERVPFDEAALVDSLGLEYVWIPLGGADHPYGPEAVDAFAAALARHPESVLLHCTVGWRASHLWSAYLVTHQGFDVSEAYRRGELMGIGVTPFAKFLDRPLTMVPAAAGSARR